MANHYPSYSNAQPPQADYEPNQQPTGGPANFRWSIPRNGILRDVITADIQRYLGNDALVKPGLDEQGRECYLISGYRNLTPSMIQDLQSDSARYQSSNTTATDTYETSMIHRSRQYYGPTEGTGAMAAPAQAQQPQQPQQQQQQPHQQQQQQQQQPQSLPSYSQQNSYDPSRYPQYYNPTPGSSAYSQQNSTSGQYPQHQLSDYPQSTAPPYSGTAPQGNRQGAQNPGYTHIPEDSQSQPQPQSQSHNPPHGVGGQDVPRSVLNVQSNPNYLQNQRHYSAQGQGQAQAQSNLQQHAQIPPGYYLASDGRCYPLMILPQTRQG